jgi:hypothetical protein
VEGITDSADGVWTGVSENTFYGTEQKDTKPYHFPQKRKLRQWVANAVPFRTPNESPWRQRPDLTKFPPSCWTGSERIIEVWLRLLYNEFSTNYKYFLWSKPWRCGNCKREVRPDFKPECPLCGKDDATWAHVILHCEQTDIARLRHARHNEGLRHLILAIERHTQWMVTADLKNRALTRTGDDYDDARFADRAKPVDYLWTEGYEEKFDENYDPTLDSDSDSSDSDWEQTPSAAPSRSHTPPPSSTAAVPEDITGLGPIHNTPRQREPTASAVFSRHEAGSAPLFPPWVFPPGMTPASRPDAVIFEGVRWGDSQPRGKYKIILNEFTYTSEMSATDSANNKKRQHATLYELHNSRVRLSRMAYGTNWSPRHIIHTDTRNLRQTAYHW